MPRPLWSARCPTFTGVIGLRQSWGSEPPSFPIALRLGMSCIRSQQVSRVVAPCTVVCVDSKDEPCLKPNHWFVLRFGTRLLGTTSYPTAQRQILGLAGEVALATRPSCRSSEALHLRIGTRAPGRGPNPETPLPLQSRGVSREVERAPRASYQMAGPLRLQIGTGLIELGLPPHMTRHIYSEKAPKPRRRCVACSP